MDGMLKMSYICAGIIIVFLYVGMLANYIREKKTYKEQRKVYIRDKQFLLMENDGDLLSLTVQKEGFDAKMHYFEESTMIITGSGDC